MITEGFVSTAFVFQDKTFSASEEMSHLKNAFLDNKYPVPHIRITVILKHKSKTSIVSAYFTLLQVSSEKVIYNTHYQDLKAHRSKLYLSKSDWNMRMASILSNASESILM